MHVVLMGRTKQRATESGSHMGETNMEATMVAAIAISRMTHFHLPLVKIVSLFVSDMVGHLRAFKK
jgi:hypothetical protein